MLRKIAISRDQDTINQCFSEIFTTRIFLCAISFIVMVIYIVCVIHDPYVYICMFILFLMAIGSMFQQNWLLKGLEKMQYITIISVTSRLVSLILIFTLIKNSSDIYVYCFLYVLTFFLIGLGGFVFVIKKIKVRYCKISLKKIPYQLHEALYTFISILGGRVMTSIGVTVLGIVAAQSDVGIYGAINKIPSVIILMFYPISQAIYPYISKRRENG